MILSAFARIFIVLAVTVAIIAGIAGVVTQPSWQQLDDIPEFCHFIMLNDYSAGKDPTTQPCYQEYLSAR